MVRVLTRPGAGGRRGGIGGVVVVQGAGVEELVGVFDGLRREHEGMAPEEFNDDATYKTRINQARRSTNLHHHHASSTTHRLPHPPHPPPPPTPSPSSRGGKAGMREARRRG